MFAVDQSVIFCNKNDTHQLNYLTVINLRFYTDTVLRTHTLFVRFNLHF